MKKTRSQKAITLVALIITIIVLLILSVVAIRAVQGDGIIFHAKNARDNYNQAQIEENGVIKGYEDYITGQLGSGSGEGSATPITADKLNTVLSTTANTKLIDKYGNPITLPAGFKIVVDNGTDASKSTSYTADTINVTKGIVIQDTNENQFVWIPVGNIKTSTTDTVGTPITLGRYSWSGSTGTLVQPIAGNDTKSPTSEVAITSGSYNYTELQPTANGKGPNGNAAARNINDFYNGSITNGGYYIGRYEASASGATIACKAYQDAYCAPGYPTASDKAKTMYADGYSSGTYSSDLVNSYAWDTAIVFIQTFGTEEDARNYASRNESTSFAETGLNPDKYCNIYDLSGNACELTTEWPSYGDANYTSRGGYFFEGDGETYGCTSDRHYSSGVSSSGSFRPVLYMAPNA